MGQDKCFNIKIAHFICEEQINKKCTNENASLLSKLILSRAGVFFSYTFEIYAEEKRKRNNLEDI